jgi:hypothetical protein
MMNKALCVAFILPALQAEMPVDRTLHLFFCKRYRSFEFRRLQSVCRIAQRSQRILVVAVADGHTYGLTFCDAKLFRSLIDKILQLLVEYRTLCRLADIAKSLYNSFKARDKRGRQCVVPEWEGGEP